MSVCVSATLPDALCALRDFLPPAASGNTIQISVENMRYNCISIFLPALRGTGMGNVSEVYVPEFLEDSIFRPHGHRISRVPLPSARVPTCAVHTSSIRILLLLSLDEVFLLSRLFAMSGVRVSVHMVLLFDNSQSITQRRQGTTTKSSTGKLQSSERRGEEDAFG